MQVRMCSGSDPVKAQAVKDNFKSLETRNYYISQDGLDAHCVATIILHYVKQREMHSVARPLP